MPGLVTKGILVSSTVNSISISTGFLSNCNNAMRDVLVSSLVGLGSVRGVYSISIIGLCVFIWLVQ